MKNIASIIAGFTTLLVILAPLACGAINSPDDVAGLKVWLDANLGVSLSGSDVTGWTDQKGGDDNGTDPGASVRPTLNSSAIGGLPAIDFRGKTTDFLPVGMTADTEIHLLAIVFSLGQDVFAQSHPSSGVGHALSGLHQPGVGSLGNFTTLTVGPVSSALANEVLSAGHFIGASLKIRAWEKFHGQVKAGPHVIVMRSDPSAEAYDFVLDGEDLPEVNAPAGGLFTNLVDELTLGKRRGDGALNLNGQIAEVLVYTQTVSQADATDISNYLIDKYSLEFSPRRIPGLELWLDAGEGVTTNASQEVTQWINQAANNLYASDPGAGKRPIFQPSVIKGRPAFNFPDTDDFIQCNLLGTAGNGTPIMVWAGVFENASPISAASAGMMLTGLRGDGTSSAPGADNFVGVSLASVSGGVVNEIIMTAEGNSRAAWTSGSAVLRAVPHILIMESTPSGYAFDLDGESLPITYVGGTFTNRSISVRVGDRIGDNAINYDSRVAEVLIYNQSMSAADKAALYAYLEQKYLIQGTMLMVR